MDPMLKMLAGLMLLVLIAAILAALFKSQDAFEPKRLLTKNEEEFFSRLAKALPDFHVFPQVAIRAFVKPKSRSTEGKAYRRQLAKIGSKHSDFLVCDGELNIVAIIELDDRSHVAERDAARDAMTGSAGYVTIRYESKNRPSVAEIRDDVLRIMAKKPKNLAVA